MTAGRPPFYETKEQLQIAIDDYFANTPENKITITGLALHLGFSTRQSLLDYQEKLEFVDTIKKAKLRVEHSYECDLKEKGNTGTIFALKNFDWTDKQEFNHGGQDGKNPVVIDVNISPEDAYKKLLGK